MKNWYFTIAFAITFCVGGLQTSLAQCDEIKAAIKLATGRNSFGTGPVGGGIGYDVTLTSANATIVISQTNPKLAATELKTALSNATSGTVIYIADNVVIDLSDLPYDILNPSTNELVHYILKIKPGVTLSSGRGQFINGVESQGALIKTPERTDGAYIFSMQASSRITGIRLEGPNSGRSGNANTHATEDFCLPSTYNDRAIYIMQSKNIEIDNCEIYSFPYTAIELSGQDTNEDGNHGQYSGSTAYIHHNYIHDQALSGEGYGVGIGGDAQACIENNIFDHNRHDVAGSGYEFDQYEAAYNITLQRGVKSIYSDGSLSTYFTVAYDMHGIYESTTLKYSSNYAAKIINIHHNTVVRNNAYYHIGMRGIPLTSLTIKHNYLTPSKWWYGYYGDNYLPWVNSSKKGKNADYLDIVFEKNDGTTVDSDGKLKIKRAKVTPDLVDSYRGEPNVTENIQIDGTSPNYVVWKTSWGGKSNWRILASQPITMDRLGYSDFDKDGSTDIFFQENGGWWIVPQGKNRTSSLRYIGQSGFEAKDLVFGDFNGDGMADIMYMYNNTWRVSFSPTNNPTTGTWSSWTDVATADNIYTVSQLKLGDFNADGRTDILVAAPTGWRLWICPAGLSPSTTIIDNTAWRTLSDTKENVAVADFDGDNKADIFYGNGSTWQIMWNNSAINATAANISLASFTTVNSSTKTVTDLAFGYFKTPSTSTQSGFYFKQGKTTDVFLADGVDFLYYSPVRNVTSLNPTDINGSGILTKDMRLGDFDNDGVSDVFRIGGNMGADANGKLYSYYHGKEITPISRTITGKSSSICSSETITYSLQGNAVPNDAVVYWVATGCMSIVPGSATQTSVQAKQNNANGGVGGIYASVTTTNGTQYYALTVNSLPTVNKPDISLTYNTSTYQTEIVIDNSQPVNYLYYVNGVSQTNRYVTNIKTSFCNTPSQIKSVYVTASNLCATQTSDCKAFYFCYNSMVSLANCGGGIEAIANREDDQTTGINNTIKLFETSISPNPASNNVTVRFGVSDKASVSIVVYDMQGRVVKADNITAAAGVTEHALDVSNFESGVYMVSIKGGDINKTERLSVVR